MASAERKNGDDHLDSPTNDSVQPSMTMHPLGYSGLPMHMYPFPPGLVPAQPIRAKRRQVKNACTNCQKACKKCDDARPCLRCVKYGVSEECVDSQRKERKKGIKRDRACNNVEQGVSAQGLPSVNGIPQPTSGSPPYVGQVGYPPGFYSQYPPPPAPKPGEGPAYFPQFYITPVPAHAPPPPPPHGGQEGDNHGYPPQHPQFYPATFLAPYAQPYPPYMMHTRPDGQMPLPNPHYAAYGAPPMYAKPASDMGASGSTRGGEAADGADKSG